LILQQEIEIFYDDNLLCNIGDVDYTKYNTASHQLVEQLTPLFCEKIMLFTLQPATELVKRNGVMLLKESTTGYLNSKIRETLKEHNVKVVGHSVKAKNVIKLLNSDYSKTCPTCRRIKDIMECKPDMEENYAT